VTGDGNEKEREREGTTGSIGKERSREKEGNLGRN